MEEQVVVYGFYGGVFTLCCNLERLESTRKMNRLLAGMKNGTLSIVVERQVVSYTKV